jgi:hypothetical protein
MRAHALAAIPAMAYVRSRAYAALGLVHALATRHADEFAVRAILDASLASIADAYDAHAATDWKWCEDTLTYDNARLCEALLRGGAALGNARYVEIGLAMLTFYASVVIEGNAPGESGRAIFAPVGNHGWYPRGGVKARYGQQPLEASAMADAAFAALDVTGDERWRSAAETAHEWFFGGNDKRAQVATKTGCRDGLDAPASTATWGPSRLPYF